MKINFYFVFINVDKNDEFVKQISNNNTTYLYFGNDISDVFVAQIIRLFYPVLLTQYDVVMIILIFGV